MIGMDSRPTLAERRKAMALSQEQLASLLGVTQGTVSRNETSTDPDRRYVLSLDALAIRHGSGEDLTVTAEQARAA